MPRLGELLTSTRLIEPEKVEQALRAQVVWGGRLGTNLIELNYIDLDGLSRALGRQHGLPAALARHFDKADPALQQRLPAELARQWSVVPLLHVGPDRKIAVVALDPLPAEGLVALADVFGCSESGIVVSIAAEMRVRYHLERVYKIARSTRYLRSRGKTITPFPQFEEFDVDTDAEVATPSAAPQPIVEKPTGRAAVPPPPVNADEITALIDEAIANATAVEPPELEAKGRERRTYVKTLAEQVAESSGEAPATPHAPTLGRIAIKRVAIAPGGDVVDAPGDSGAPSSLPEATRAIRRGPNRDRVAELVIETLQRFVPTCEAALLLVIRGDVAIGWRHFHRDGESSADVAVPLDEGGLVPRAIMHNMPARMASSELVAIDELLLRSLGQIAGDGDLAVVPIAINGKVMCLLAAATDHVAPLSALEVIASAAGAAFTRLMRDASR